MSSVKISQLPAASTLTGDELLPAVQAGQTVGASVAQIRTGLLNSTHAGSGGTAHAMALPNAAAGFMSGADKAKIDGIQASATANGTDAQLRDRTTHTGTQPHTTITGLGTMATQDADAVAITGGTATLSTLTTTGTTVFNGGLDIGANAIVILNGANPNPMRLDVGGRVRIGSGTSTGDSELLFRSYGTPANASWALSLRQDVGGANDDMKLLRFIGGVFQGIALQVDNSNGNTTPGTDNAQTLGSAVKRWSEVFAVTGTISTSDEREKEEVAPIAVPMAERLLRAIDPVTFKWRDIDHPEIVETRHVRRQRVMPEEIEVDEVVRTDDGRFIRARRTVVEQRPVFEPHPIHGEDGAALLDANGEPMIHWEPVMEEVEEQVTVQPAYHKANVRTHWGFIAQQVERGLCAAMGTDPADPEQSNQARLGFAGLVYDREADRFGLREGQFIPILWAVVRDLLNRVESLEAARLPA